MTRRSTARAAIGFAHALALCASIPTAFAAADPPPADRLRTLADEYVEERLRAVPEVVYFGLSDALAERVDHGRLADNSPSGLARARRLEDDFLARLNEIDGEQLRRTDIAAWVVWSNLREQLLASVGLRVCRHELWDVNHMSGWQTLYARVAAAQPLGDAQARAAALRRWSRLPTFIAQQQRWLREGLDAGYSVPVSVVDRVLGQLDALLTTDPAASALAAFATRSEDSAYRQQALALVTDRLVPALRAHRQFLADHYRPRARETLGLAALPNGLACYHAWLRHYTTLTLTAEEMLARGQSAVAANLEAVREVGAERYGTDEVREIIRRNNRVAANSFSSREEFIRFARHVTERAERHLGTYFAYLPRQRAIVEPYPDYLAGSGQSSRYERNGDLSSPAVFRLATDGWETATRGATQILAVHEVWPGHHLQIATVSERLRLHPAMEMAGNSAYTEGWARYAEGLAEEAGVYEGPYASITRRAWPARGMVVDPGIHAFGWSREEAIAYLRASGRFAGEQAHIMVDRIAVLPGQLTAYDTGALEIAALRRHAEQALGAQFSLPAFHTAILGNGELPLSALGEEVRRWVASQGRPSDNTTPLNTDDSR